MKVLAIGSVEALDARVADVVRLKIEHTALTAEKDAELALVEKRHQARLVKSAERIAALEGEIQAYCEANRKTLFSERKSRETNLALIGFETTPPRVETTSRKITWKEVVERLQRLAWGPAYVRTADPKPDKEALLADREKLTEEQRMAAGIRFAQDEQFYIRPKPETAEGSAGKVAA